MKLLEKKTINGNATVTETKPLAEPQPMPAPLNRIYDKRGTGAFETWVGGWKTGFNPKDGDR